MEADADVSLTIQADDLTGACDTGALFAGPRPVPVTLWPRRPPVAPVRVIDTETRACDAAEAARRVAALATPATGRWFKKVDSTLRGRVGAELDAVMRAGGAATALVCPALPSQGRVVLDRTLLVDGVPVGDTAIACDPQFPRAAGSSVVEILRLQIDRPLAWVPIDQLREGPAELAARLRRLHGTVVVADAETDGDLDVLVDAALALALDAPLLAGSAGLARALARHLGLLGERVDLPPGRRWLVVAGSQHPVAIRQAEQARAAGLRVVVAPAAPEPDRARVVARVAAEAAAALAREPCDLVVVTGGETAAALLRALGAERLDLVGVPGPGLALGRLQAPGHPDLPVLTKAGGFGAPDLLVSLLAEAVA